ADINARSDDGTTPLMAATHSGQDATIRFLLDKGADVLMRNHRGWSALLFAAGRGLAATGEVMVERGASVNAASSDGWTPMLIAASERSPAFLRMLLKHQANVGQRTPDGRTGLILACEDNEEMGPPDLYTVQVLLDAGAEPNAADHEGWTPLMMIARYGSSEVARALLEHGADIGAKNNKKQTALAIALESGQ